MRVLHVISGLDPQNGGPTTALVGLAAAQAAAGLDVTVFATWKIHDGLPVAESLRGRGVAVHHLGPATGKLSRHPKLTATARLLAARADVVHIHALFEEIQHQAARAARRARVPYIVRPCGMLGPWAMAQGALAKRLYLCVRLRANLDRAAAIHYTTDAERDEATVRPAAPAIVEPNGLDLAEFRDLPPRGTFRARFPEIGERPIVLFLGRLSPQKGLDLLLPAFAAAEGASGARLVLAGPDHDGYRATVESLVARHHLADRVVFTGMLRGPDRLAALADADLFVLPSRQENFGIAVVEAMAAGVAVVVSDQVNLCGTVAAAGAGSVVPLQVEPLAAEIARQLADAPGRLAAGTRGRAMALATYDWDAIARRWAAHYRSLTARE